MLDGEATYNVFKLIPKNPLPTTPTLDLPDAAFQDCCNDFALKALADTSDSDPYRNDVSGFIWWFYETISTVTLTLQKYNESTETFADLVALNDNTYGTFYALGFWTNDANEQHIGYQLEWREVLDIHGAGGYRVKCVATDSVTGSSETYYSWHYCLKAYTAARANGTVRVEYYLNGVLGDVSDDERVKDFGTINWYNSFRLPGWFGFTESTYKDEYVKYQTGQFNYVQDEQNPEFMLRLKGIPMHVHNILRTDMMMADSILLTDYNGRNYENLVSKKVKKNSGYAPDTKNRLNSGLAPVEVKFIPEFNNHRKLRG